MAITGMPILSSMTLRLSLLLLLAAAAAFPLYAADAPKRVVVCTVTTGFRHSSIPHAERMLQRLADETKAFTIVDFARQPEIKELKKPNKPKDLKPDADEKAKEKMVGEMKKYEEEMAKWTPEMEAKAAELKAQTAAGLTASLAKLSPASLIEQKIDAVIFANTTGDLPLPDKEGFVKWVQDGHAWIGMHSATDTFHGFPKFIEMIGGEFDGHGAQVPADLIQADANHPATAGLPATWRLNQEELYLMKNHDRAKLRSLWHMRVHPNKPTEMGYFPVSWCRKAGTGRVFYTSLGHREDLWDDSADLKDRKNTVEISNQFRLHVLGGIKWALGLAEGSAEPNPEVK